MKGFVKGLWFKGATETDDAVEPEEKKVVPETNWLNWFKGIGLTVVEEVFAEDKKGNGCEVNGEGASEADIQDVDAVEFGEIMVVLGTNGLNEFEGATVIVVKEVFAEDEK